MANEMVTAANLSRDAALLLNDELVIGNAINRDVEQKFTSSSGGQVTVTYVPEETARSQDHKNTSPSTLSSNDITETDVSVDALHYLYVRKEITTKQKNYELNDFTKKVVAPAVRALAREIEAFLVRQLSGGFARHMVGTRGVAANGATDITSARKLLLDNGCPMGNLVGLLDSQAEKNFLDMEIFQSNDYANAGTALQRAILPPRFQVSKWLVSTEAGTHKRGDIDGTPLLKGSASTGATSITIDGFTDDTGYIYPGAQFTIAGTDTVYTVIDTAYIGASTNGEATVSISPALTADEADNDAITFLDAYIENMIFNPAACVGALIAPAPLMNNSSVQQINGLSVRVSMESSVSTDEGAKDYILFDLYAGAKTLREEYGVIMQGTESGS